MGFGVCLHYEDREESIRQWGYILAHWPPDNAYVIASDVPTGYPLATWLQSLAALSAHRLVYVTADRNNAVMLHKFRHPEQCIYVFGPDGGGRIDLDCDRIHIPTASDLQMYAHQAAVAVLYSRYAQRGGHG